ncbi:Pheromone-regulated membrane protein 10 [Candida viswanathii]|uniref:Pheromone-regulated membrane protein 10 n=1 Tax=Candida viswanathii TaxID=5486 RepID=A0A367YHT0_9ASCO|nr:Pheromone-regulated membrane protein 10 [Candida viswanathii]
MQPLSSYNDLSAEAKDLINQHLPGVGGSVPPSAEITPSQSPHNGVSSTTPEEGNDGESETKERPERSTATETDFMNMDSDYIAPPKQVQAGVLSSLLRLYQNPQDDKSMSSLSRTNTGISSYDDSWDNYDAESTVDMNKYTLNIKDAPKVMFSKASKFLRHPHHSRSDTVETKGSFNLDELYEKDYEKGSDDELGEGGEDVEGMGHLPSFQNAKPKMPKKKAPDPVHNLKKLRHKKRRAERLRITVHIADILQRQRFIMNMCRALMLFGAPTHRLEEYMVMTSRVLEIDGQFIYFPGCMLISFGDAATRTSEVHLVRCAQGLNLSKLADTHKIYKSVIHDLIGVEEASHKIDDLLKSKNRYPPWLCVLIHGLGSGVVTVWAFDGGWLDIPICFGIGSCVGYLLYYVSPMSTLYSSIFEVTSAIVVSFIGRGIASVRVKSDLFCFSAITQVTIRNLVAGAVRMFYAIIYSLFLGFGITLGAALYGWIDHNATSDNSCEAGHNIDDKWRILFVPLYASLLGLLNQARWTELPVMVIIAGVGYIGTYFAGKHFSQVTEFTACIGAFIIGILGNMYSRMWKGMAVSAMLPAIFVQVPSGIARRSPRNPTPTPTTGTSTGHNEDYKIYSILGYNSLKDREGDDEWSIIQFEPRLKCLICTVLDMYLVLYFDSEEIGDEYVKVKLEGLALALREGLKGYNEDRTRTRTRISCVTVIYVYI